MPPASSGASAASKREGVRGMARILYVEGNPEKVELLRPLLVRQGHTVDVVNCAERAMLRVQARRDYAAVVLQLYLPGMDGAELCRWMEKWSAVRGVHKLVFTWHGRRAPVVLSRGLPRWLPADRFIENLERAEDLVEALETLLSNDAEAGPGG